MKKATEVRQHIFGRDVRPVEMSAQDCADFADLTRLGIDISPSFIRSQMRDMLDGASAMDDTQPLITTASVATPIQFLQAWLPGFVRVMTAARKIDSLIGIAAVGKWEDEEVIQGVLEPVGEAALYGDLTNVPLSSWNVNFERRTVLRFEKGFKVGILEDARSARVRINTAAEKRAAAALSLDIVRNRIGFYGFNAGNNRTYGFLNDPSLPAYVPANNTGTGPSTLWSTKTFLNITADIRGMLARLRTQSQDSIDIEKAPITFAIATNVIDFLTVTSDFGISVKDWLKSTFPNVRLESAPELNLANGGANVAYMYVDNVNDGGSDGGATWVQMVPSKFQALGTEKQAKAYLEDFANATAGVMVKRPFAVTRLTGI